MRINTILFFFHFSNNLRIIFSIQVPCEASILRIHSVIWIGFLPCKKMIKIWLLSYFPSSTFAKQLPISMITLLMHTIAHSTKPSFMHKTNNQATKKLLSLALSWAKVFKNGKILTFKVNFLRQKIPKLSDFKIWTSF